MASLCIASSQPPLLLAAVKFIFVVFPINLHYISVQGGARDFIIVITSYWEFYAAKIISAYASFRAASGSGRSYERRRGRQNIRGTFNSPPLIYLQLATAQPSGTPSGNIYTRRTINLGFDKDLMLMF